MKIHSKHLPAARRHPTLQSHLSPPTDQHRETHPRKANTEQRAWLSELSRRALPFPSASSRDQPGLLCLSFQGAEPWTGEGPWADPFLPPEHLTPSGVISALDNVISFPQVLPAPGPSQSPACLLRAL